MSKIKLGVVGGSGIYEIEGVENHEDLKNLLIENSSFIGRT